MATATLHTQQVKKSLPALLVIFAFSIVMLQAFNLVYQNVGNALAMPESAALLTAIPGIVLGIVCMLYSTLCDFIPLRGMSIFGVCIFVVGSLIGFFGSFNFWIVLVGRIIQTAGGQVAGSVFLVTTVKYLDDKEKPIYIGIYGAVYYFAAALGAVTGGIITSIDWRYLILIPVVSVVFLPTLIKNLPNETSTTQKIDVFGISIFGLFAALLVIWFSYPFVEIIGAALLFLVVFGFYVVHGKHPFIDVAFLKNVGFLLTVLVIFGVCFFNYSLMPLFNTVCSEVHKISIIDISLACGVISLVAAVVGLMSGKLVGVLGRVPSIYTAIVLIAVGFIGFALFISAGLVLLTVCASLIIAGGSLGYTALYDCAADTLPTEENGRGMGICDLILNVSGSIGVAIYAGLLTNPSLKDMHLVPGVAADSTSYANICLFFAVVALITLALFALSKKTITKRA